MSATILSSFDDRLKAQAPTSLSHSRDSHSTLEAPPFTAINSTTSQPTAAYARNSSPHQPANSMHIGLDSEVGGSGNSFPNDDQSSRDRPANRTPLVNFDSASSGYTPEVLKARVDRILDNENTSGSVINSSFGSSWGVSSIGKGFDWTWSQENSDASDAEEETAEKVVNDVKDSVQTGSGTLLAQTSSSTSSLKLDQKPQHRLLPTLLTNRASFKSGLAMPLVTSPTHFTHSPKGSPPISRSNSPLSSNGGPLKNSFLRSSSSSSVLPTIPQKVVPQMDPTLAATGAPTTPISRSPSSPRYRRRSSQKRISLIAGRVSYQNSPPPSPPPADSIELHDPNDGSAALSLALPSPKLLRLKSNSSFMSLKSTIATAPPTPGEGVSHRRYLGEKSIGEFVIQGDVGRGAYGLVKRGREVMLDGSYGPEVIIKQVIKSRILADCWKKHPTHGTIPIEIYVMLALSSATYVLPARRPWDPHRAKLAKQSAETSKVQSTPEPAPDDGEVHSISSLEDFEWVEGRLVQGHPNICPLLDFFEDRNYYYLILPSTLPPLPEAGSHLAPPQDPAVNAARAAKDLFDLVELYPGGLPSFSIRTYLGQIADAMAFLHSRGIVHRDIKDENVILGGPVLDSQFGGGGGRCWLIDFGSAGVVRKSGWNSFSGTLDYASPEILRGEFYTGKEQDVWAFGVVAYVLLVGECPFATAQDAQIGLIEGSGPWESLDARCGGANQDLGEEEDGGGRLSDARQLVMACLAQEVNKRPSFEEVMRSRYLVGRGGWEGFTPSTAATPT